MHRRRISTRRTDGGWSLRRGATAAALAGAGLVATMFPGAANAGFDDAEQILLGGTLGGTRGLRVRRIGAPMPAFSTNATHVYYPASSIKVLEHLYSMVLVDDDIWNLVTTTPDICTNGSNCGSGPNAGSGCGVQSWQLDDVLDDMMTISSNQATNAIQEEVGRTFFPQNSNDYSGPGRALMTGFAQSTLGMPDTELNHKLGCGGPCENPSPNQLTLVDIEELYQDVAGNTTVLSVARRLEMHDLMLNESNSFLGSVINDEATATGKNAYRDQFKAKVFMIFKDGSYTCSGNLYLSTSGLLQLPTYNGAYKRLYTWGIMVDESQDWAYISGTISAARKELLRYAVHAALLTWGNNYLVLDLAGDGADAVEALPLYNDSGPIGALLQGAARSIRLAIDDLDRTERDYGPAVGHLKDAVDALVAARGIDPAAAPEALVDDLVALSLKALEDAISLIAMTSDASILELTIANMEALVATARQLQSTGDPSGAMGSLQSAAGFSTGMIAWASRGPLHDDDGQGFIGAGPADLIFQDGLESEDFGAWSASQP